MTTGTDDDHWNRMAKRSYAQADSVVTTQRCAFGDDSRGYCGARAVEHVWVEVHGSAVGAVTMACAEHSDLVDHPVRDRHPVCGPCGLPGAVWVYSNPTGGHGWCELDGFDWLAAVEPAAVEPEHEQAAPAVNGGQHVPWPQRRLRRQIVRRAKR